MRRFLQERGWWRLYYLLSRWNEFKERMKERRFGTNPDLIERIRELDYE